MACRVACAVADWLHRGLAGLAPAAPGYRKVTTAPIPGGGITWAHAELDSPYGTIDTHWKRDGRQLTVEATIPPGVTAEVSLPGGAPTVAGHGTHRWMVPDNPAWDERPDPIPNPNTTPPE